MIHITRRTVCLFIDDYTWLLSNSNNNPPDFVFFGLSVDTRNHMLGHMLVIKPTLMLCKQLIIGTKNIRCSSSVALDNERNG